VQVQQRQHLGDLRRAPAPAGEDHALELHPSAGGGVGAPVIYPRADELHLADPGGDGARWGVPVAHHQPVAVLIDQLGVGRAIGPHLGLQRHRQHPPGTFAEQLLQVQGQLSLCVLISHYTQHRGVPSSPASARRRPPHRSGWKVRRALMPGTHPQVPTITPSTRRLISVLLSTQIAMKRHGAGCGDVKLGCWQIARSSAMRALQKSLSQGHPVIGDQGQSASRTRRAAQGCSGPEPSSSSRPPAGGPSRSRACWRAARASSPSVRTSWPAGSWRPSS
jgi:hypothetical protein